MKIIMSLGEVVTSSIGLTVGEFVTLISGKTAKPIQEVQAQVVSLLGETKSLVDDFKLGRLNEEGFTSAMIARMQASTGVELTAAEFNQAWLKMVPEYIQYKEVLEQVIQANRPPNQEVILVSATNPKDMDKIFTQLSANGIPVEACDDGSYQVAGMKLYVSYRFSQDKVALVRHQVERLRKEGALSPFVDSLSAAVGFSKQAEEIAYVYGPNGMKDPELKAYCEELEHTNRTLQESMPLRFVLWDKKSQSFASVIESPAVSREAVSASTLSS